MDWTGSMTGGIDRLEKTLRDAAERAVMLAGEHVLGEATKIVPLEEGTLSRSGKVTAETQADAAVAAVSYDTPYAARQHEDMGFRHDPGRRAKYLEGPLTGEAAVAAQIMAQAVREALR